MEQVKIFIASALKDLELERAALANFIYETNNRIKNKYNVELVPIYCEAEDHRYSSERMQSIFNDKLSKSNIAIFMFYHDAGKYTQEEFDVATKHYDKEKSPIIYVFFKDVKSGEPVTQELEAFKKNLDDIHNHYPEFFAHIDTIKLRILLCLHTLIDNIPHASTEDGFLFFGDTPLISLKNVSEFANNEVLSNLQSEYEEVESQYIDAKSKYDADKTEENEQSYEKLALQRAKLKKSIHEMQKNIFAMSLNMCQDSIHGNISVRQKKAYECFEKGKYEECIAILSEKDIEEDFEKNEQQLLELQIKNAEKFIAEQTMAIKILEMMVNEPSRHEQIKRRYEKILPISRKYRVRPFVFYYYASFLVSRRLYNEAKGVLEDLQRLYIDEGHDAFATQLAKLYNLSGVMNYLVGDYDAAKKCCLETKKIGEALLQTIEDGSAQAQAQVGSGLARVYNNLGILSLYENNVDESEAMLVDALNRFKLIAEENQIYKADVADVLKNIGYLCLKTNRIDEAEIYFEDALDIYNRCLTFDDKYQIVEKISKANCGISIINQIRENWAKAERYLIRALNKIQEIADVYPEFYDDQLAAIYSGLAFVYQKMGDQEKSKLNHDASCELYGKLHQETPEVFGEEMRYLNGISDNPKVSWYDSIIARKYLVSLFH